MSCILTNLSDNQEDTLCSSPPCVCSLAHFPLYCFMSLYRISNASVHLGPSDVCRERFFVTYTPTHRTGSRCGPNLCLLFLFCQLYLSFSCFLSPLFLTAIIFSLPFVSAFLFWLQEGKKHGERKWQRHRDREKRVRKVQGEIVGLALYQWWHSTKSWAQVSVCPATDSVRRGSEWI